jgi:GT2 family glycosyltransferase/glycosyltransferase involved in cell wall biosynthesis
MAPPGWQEARRGIVVGRIVSRMRSIARAVSRFRSVAGSDGIAAALARAGRKIRRMLGRHSRILAMLVDPDRCPYFTPPAVLDPYDAWLRVNRDNPRRRRRWDAALRSTAHGAQPRFSIVVPVYNPPIDVLRAMIGSVIDQTVGDWELVLVDDASPDRKVCPELRDWSVADGRIRVIERGENGNISVATNEAAAAARGEFLVLLDHDDLLAPDALAHLSLYLDTHPEADLVYSDEDKVDADGRRHSPQFKPDWSPELLLGFCYTAHLTVIRRRLYNQAGGMRVGFEGSQDHDFWLRASELARGIGHVPQVLYHWRILPGSTALSGHCKPASFEAGRRAVEETFHRRGVVCRIRQIDWAAGAGCAIFEPVMPDDGSSVAILIPSRNHGPRLKIAIDSLAKTTYRNYRIYVLDNDSDDRPTLEYLASLPHRVLRISNRDGRFNFSAINNSAAAMVQEDLLLFLNDDTDVINPRWLSQMVGWSRLEGVGAVGARLLFPDRRVQHAGIILGAPEGLAGHAFRYSPWWDPGHLNLSRVSRNCRAVTAACMLTPRQLFLRLGGFDEGRFGVAYNDPDYCYRLGDAGYRCVYCAEAELYHHEGLSRGLSGDPREMAAYREVHGHRVDPYFSPHLDPEREAFAVAPTVVPIGPRHEPVPVLAVTHNLNWEGAPRIEFELVRRLHASGAIRAEVLSPSDGPIRRAYEEEGIPIRIEPDLAEVSFNMDLYREGIDRLAARIADGGYDVVHANTFRAFWAIEAARRAGIPSVWSVHESERWQSYFDNLPEKVAASALSCLAYPYRLVFSSKSTLHVWSALNTSGNFGLIRYAHDVPRFLRGLEEVDRPRARRDLDLAEGDVCVLLLGTVCERKGQHDLLRAFAALPGPVSGRIRCFVVGGRDAEPYSRQLERLAKKLPPDRRDRFAVVPETGQTAPYWRAADVFCCTSRMECYPLVILEAMAVGLPIITTPVFGIAEQVWPSVNALIYQPGDIATLARHLALLAEDHSLRRALAEMSPHVLRSLPNDARMNELYRRTILGAAESSPPFPSDAGADERDDSSRSSGRRWFADSRLRRGTARRRHHAGATSTT